MTRDEYYIALDNAKNGELMHTFKYIKKYINSNGNTVYVYADSKAHKHIQSIKDQQQSAENKASQYRKWAYDNNLAAQKMDASQRDIRSYSNVKPDSISFSDSYEELTKGAKEYRKKQKEYERSSYSLNKNYDIALESNNYFSPDTMKLKIKNTIYSADDIKDTVKDALASIKKKYKKMF